MKVTYSLQEACDILCQHAANHSGEPAGKMYAPHTRVEIPVLEGAVQFSDIVFNIDLGEPRDAP